RGTVAMIAPGKTPRALDLALSGTEIGTVFLPSPRGLGSRAHWIAHTLRAKGTIVVDAGAVEALIERKRSLLPTGLVALEGDFAEGGAVELTGPDGTVVARGVSADSSSELESIRGKRAKDIHGILGYHLGDEVIRRDDLVMLKPIPSPSGRGLG